MRFSKPVLRLLCALLSALLLCSVCFAAAADRTLVVPDVHQFPGHIACDSASRSEIVVPLHKDGRVIGVLDIDSPQLSRFSEADQAGLEQLAALVEKKVLKNA